MQVPPRIEVFRINSWTSIQRRLLYNQCRPFVTGSLYRCSEIGLFVFGQFKSELISKKNDQYRCHIEQ